MATRKHSKETLKKMSESQKGKKLSEEHKEKLKEAWKKRRLTPVTKETRDKLSKASKGRTTGWWSYTGWEEAGNKSKEFDSFKVYIIKCYNDKEEFYKIGKTFLTIKRRFIRLPYNYKIIKIFKGSSRIISELENTIQKENKEFKYIPIIKFSGMQECFKNIKINIT